MRVIFSELNPEAQAFSCDLSKNSSTGSSGGSDGESSGSDAALAAKRSGRYSVNKLDFDSLENEPHDVASFLRFLRLHKYIDSINQQRITLVQLLNMSEDDLIQVGFTAHGARKRLLTGIQRYHEFLGRTWSADNTDLGNLAPSSPELAGSNDNDLLVPVVGGTGGCLEVRSSPDLLRRQSTSPVLHRRTSAFVNLGLPEQVEWEMSKQYYSSRASFAAQQGNVAHEPVEEVYEDFMTQLGSMLHFIDAADE